MKEVHRIAVASGIEMREGSVDEALRWVGCLPADATPSQLRDVVSGRPSELEHLSGAVVRLGLRYKISTPVHSSIYGSLLPMEALSRQATSLADQRG
jgi:2-dehydropantoate 2-reductase